LYPHQYYLQALQETLPLPPQVIWWSTSKAFQQKCPTCHLTHYISKAETAVQVTRSLQNIINQPLSAPTSRRYMKKAGVKAVVKKKKPLSTTGHGERGWTLH
jgi:hypothetical protein